MRPTITVSSSGDASYIGSAIKELDGDQLYVGIPEQDAYRKQDFIGPMPQHSQSVTNAGLLYIHTNGSQLRHIPPRPVIEPAIQANRQPIEMMLFKAADATFDNNKREANRWIRECGQFASNACKLWFTDRRNGWPQNAPSTIAKKLSKLQNKKGRMSVRHKKYLNAMTVLSLVPQYMPRYGTTALDNINTPLIDTAQLRRAITYVVKR